jgi:hypothetical protein
MAFGYGQQIAAGLLNFNEATNFAYSRPYANSPDLFEFDYFLDTGYGYSLDASLGDFTVGAPTPADFYFSYANEALSTNVYRIVLSHTAGTTTISGQILTNGVLYIPLNLAFPGPIADFQLDTLAIESYADDGFGDDILAHGVIDNITVTSTPPVASDTAIFENFFADPAQHGWQTFGATNLFIWNPTNQDIDATWDSSQSNTYFYKPLKTVLTKADAFALDFDITLADLQWTNSFEIAAGFLNLATATNPGFSRALGYSPNLFEFNYFPDDGLGEPNVAASMTDAKAITNFPDYYFVFAVQPLDTGTKYPYHIHLSHDAGSGMLHGAVYTNGVLYTAMDQSYPGNIKDFQLDTLSISSYSGAGQDPDYYPGAILAHGSIDNFEATLPPPAHNLVCSISAGHGRVTFGSYTGWGYTLQSSTDLSTWSDASLAAAGNGATVTLTDRNPVSQTVFYRVRANKF